MRQYKQLLLANKAWATEMVEEHPEFFSRQVAGQSPDFLWIGCSDSRVSPEQMTMTHPGGMFMHRNIANLVNEDDLNLMSVIQYAVSVLRVKHIIVCGHYGCGGIAASINGGTTGPVHEWLTNPRVTRDLHDGELASIHDHGEKVDRLVELNVIDQLQRLSRVPTIQEAFAIGQPLKLHGWVYGLSDGLIHTLSEIEAPAVRQRSLEPATTD
jgi:carbonic anhydrase